MSNRIPNSEVAVDIENDPVCDLARDPAHSSIRDKATKVLKERILACIRGNPEINKPLSWLCQRRTREVHRQ